MRVTRLATLALAWTGLAAVLPSHEKTRVRREVEKVFPGAATASRETIRTMNADWYNRTDGRWSTADAWWVSGNALQNILDFTMVTGDAEFMATARHTFALQRVPLAWWPQGGGDFRGDSTDDTAWWALAMIRMFDVTGDEIYRAVAEEDETYMHQFWNSSLCGGGIIWDVPSQSYKNAISNELYIKLTASLHNRIAGDTLYLNRSVTAWEWFENSGMINRDKLVNDGLAQNPDNTCYNNGATTWTYNQGVILGALAELYKATGNQSYLDEARLIADAVVSSKSLSPAGILTESCDGPVTCDGNQQMFKGVFMRNLMELDRASGGHPYRAYVLANAVEAWTRDRNASNDFDVAWAGPYNKTTIASQASAVALYVSLI